MMDAESVGKALVDFCRNHEGHVQVAVYSVRKGEPVNAKAVIVLLSQEGSVLGQMLVDADTLAEMAAILGNGLEVAHSGGG